MIKNVLIILTIVILVSLVISSCSVDGAKPSMYTDLLDNDTLKLGLGITFSTFQKQDEWIYYLDFATGELWRVTIDGEGKAKVCEDEVYSFIVHKDRVFYTSGYQATLCSVKTDGSDKIIFELDDTNIHVRKMDVVGDWIYAQTLSDRLYRIKTDFIDYAMLDKNVCDFGIDGEWIYYTKLKIAEKYSGYEIWRMNTDGINKQQLMQPNGFAIDYNEDLVYYTDIDSDISVVPFFDEDGQKIINCNGNVRLLKVIGDWIYYEDWGEKPGVYKAKKDGSERTFITGKYNALFYTIWDNWFLCIDSDIIIAIKVRNTEETDKLIIGIMSEWSDVEIYE